MKFLVIGLGSMGKRRVRCLKALGYNNITGFDRKPQRREEASKLYGINVINDLINLDYKTIDAFIISTPPDHHTEYLKKAIEKNIPAFVEASVILEHVQEIARLNQEKNILIAPSCTLEFHPIIKDIKEIVSSAKYGKVTNFSYHSGQYLPDWHPWEDVKDFYVSNRITGGGREIVPFELTWLTDILGFPTDIKGHFTKTIDMGINIEDTYTFSMKYPDMSGIVIVDVASRFATRNLILNMENAQLLWNWNDGAYSVYEVQNNNWIKYNQPEGKNEPGYNKNIIEDMYIEEVETFISAMNNKNVFPNNLENDIKVLELLDKIEKSDNLNLTNNNNLTGFENL